MRIKLIVKDRPKEWELFSLEKTEENIFLKDVKGCYRKAAHNVFCISLADRITNNRSKEDSGWTSGIRESLSGSASEGLQ